MKTISVLFILVSTFWMITGCSEAKYDTPNRGSVSAPKKDPHNPDRLVEEHELGIYSNKMDIVFVVSKSSRDYADKIRESFRSFTDDVSDIDWRVGFTNGSLSKSDNLIGKLDDIQGIDNGDEDDDEGEDEDGKGIYLTSDVDNLEDVFLKNILRERNCSSGWFKGCHPVLMKVSERVMDRSENKDFFREEADLVFVYITSQVDGRSERGWNGALLNAFQKNINNINMRKQIVAHGIVVPHKDWGCVNKNNPLQGRNQDSAGLTKTEAQKTIEVTGGQMSSICAVDYREINEGMGFLVGKTSRVLRLSMEAKYGTVKLIADPYQELTWREVGSRTVVIDRHLEKNTRIRVSYESKDGRIINNDNGNEESVSVLSDDIDK